MWELYYKQIDGNTVISATKKVGWFKLTFTDNQDFNNGGCPPNIKWVDGKPQLKTEAEKMPMLIPGKVSQLYQTAQAYVFSRGYDTVTLARMLAFLTEGNEAQKALCNQVLAFTDNVTINGYYARKAQAETCTTFDALNAISDDYSDFDSSDPEITLIDIQMAGGA